MKVIYCSKRIDTKDLKMQPTAYRSSKIRTMHTKTKPYFVKEFTSVENIEYITGDPSPRFADLWEDMMSKRTFSYNFEHLDSKEIFDEYVEHNKKTAERIKINLSPRDLVIVNDASLYLLPDMLPCKVAVRNIRFDESFIERVPMYENILKALVKAQKFFLDRKSIEAFNNYMDVSPVFWEAERGGCWYMKTPVNKDAVLEVLQACHSREMGTDLDTPCDCENCKRLPEEQETCIRQKINDYLEMQPATATTHTILTNAQLLHLEAYIKEYPKTRIRYLRDTVEFNEEQELMIQYLKKTYECAIDTVDTYDFHIIILEMLHCDIFVGDKYYELAKLLRKPLVSDKYDPIVLKDDIEARIGKIQGRYPVQSEDEYIKDFVEINGYQLLQKGEVVCLNGAVDSVLLLYLKSREKERIDNLMGLCEGMQIEPDGSTLSNGIYNCNCSCHRCVCKRGELYERVIRGRRVLFKRVSVLNKGRMNGCSLCANCRSDCTECKTLTETTEKDELPGEKKTAMVLERESDGGPDERNCYCNNGKHYYNGVMGLCDCEKSRIQKMQPLASEKENKKPTAVPHANWKEIKEFWKNSNKVSLFDYDGTLVPMYTSPEEAVPSEYILDLLKRFSQHGRFVLCTGRSCADSDAWFPPELEIYAEHGALHRVNGKWTKCRPVPRIDECREVMSFYHERTPGTMIEDKESACAFHYTKVPDFPYQGLFSLLRKIVGDSVYLGKGSLEVRSGSKDVVCQKVAPSLCAGDDRTDEDMYKFCSGISIKVGNEPTTADCCVKDSEEMVKLIEYLLE